MGDTQAWQTPAVIRAGPPELANPAKRQHIWDLEEDAILDIWGNIPVERELKNNEDDDMTGGTLGAASGSAGAP